jgi:hypothetical protein
MKFVIGLFFENLSRKFKLHASLTRITGTLHKDVCTFMIISRSVFLKRRKFSDKNCRQSQNKPFMFNNVFPKIIPFTT